MGEVIDASGLFDELAKKARQAAYVRKALDIPAPPLERRIHGLIVDDPNKISVSLAEMIADLGGAVLLETGGRANRAAAIRFPPGIQVSQELLDALLGDES